MPAYARSLNRNIIRLLLVLVAVVIGACSPARPMIRESAYSVEELDYFSEVAFGAEYGPHDARIKKWTQDVRIQISGAPTHLDSFLVQEVVDELSAIARTVRVFMVDEAPTVDVRFVTQEEIDRLRSGPCDCFGLATARYNQRREILSAQVFILSTVSQRRRVRAIREELTQMMGLMVDSHAYPTSIFCQVPADVIDYAPIDRKLIEMLYRPEVRPGMTRAEALRVLGKARRLPDPAREPDLPPVAVANL